MSSGRITTSPGQGQAVREHRPAASERGGTPDDDPFAPPPEDAPDRPWSPRRPAVEEARGSGGNGDSGGNGPAPGGRWSDRQPGEQHGGFGDRPGGPGPGTGPGGSRFDPKDPVQRRSRYALLAGMWGVFFGLLGLPEVGLLLGALAVYWGFDSLRAKPRAAASATGTDGGRPAGADGPRPTGAPGPRPQAAAARGGLVAGVMALVIAGSVFTVQLVYKDYYDCVSDSLTSTQRQNCSELLPEPLRSYLEVPE